MSSCNENHLDISCKCSSKFNQGNLSKIYDINTGEYVCCGNIGYDMYSAFQTEGNLRSAAASLDDSRCQTWWNGNINKNDTIALSNAGPTQSKLDIVENQLEISTYFPEPVINATNNTYSCVGVISPGLTNIPTVPKYVIYENPNAGEQYIETIECIPKGNSYQELASTEFTKTGNFAIYSIVGCTDEQICKPLNGTMGLSIGKEEFKSDKYNGHITPDDKDCHNNNNYYTWWIVALVILSIIFLIIVIILFFAGDSCPPTINKCLPPPPPTCLPPPKKCVSFQPKPAPICPQPVSICKKPIPTCPQSVPICQKPIPTCPQPVAEVTTTTNNFLVPPLGETYPYINNNNITNTVLDL